MSADATNHDVATPDIADAIFTLGYLFASEPAPSCLDAADANDDGALEIIDAVYLPNFLSLGGPAPPEPFPTCNPDQTIDELGCESFVGCEE